MTDTAATDFPPDTPGPDSSGDPGTAPYALLLRGTNTAAHGVQVALPRGSDGEPERILRFQGEAWELLTQSVTRGGFYEYGNPRTL
ncbi:hypothetical protein [Subtercola boreus]|uniref:Uncharacterized protein n=1 Tax=Subtercola boreus TaxID=120213 RepID=A0A3E0WAX6_9MICO|nr:hypothetical protein [Subtercola boreus]RFA19088.1 hypothetical protein B7R24_13240 [Subtercola boreus]RFA25688.1 hypothetical protein B7R25_13340 [Subtercola boreus]